MATKYPDFYTFGSSLIPVVRIALIKRLDEICADIKIHTDYKRWQCIFDCINEAQLIENSLKDLDSHIVFDDDEECPF